MTENKGLHLLYKNLGETPNERILRFKKENPQYTEVSMTYAGRLDPMAEGLLLVVSGNEIKSKDSYQNLEKTYEVQILWGFETDTLDVLGKVTNSGHLEVSKEEVEKKIDGSIGKFEQKYPDYSSKSVNGKSLFQWAREGRIGEIEIPAHTVEILNTGFISRRQVLGEELLQDVKSKIALVKGDFRQTEILQRWQEVLGGRLEEKFSIDTIRLDVSSGFYVRQFVKDLDEKLGSLAVTFHIKRTRIGEYAIAQSKE